ncbi:ATP-binding cassette domain-containing protein, partial [candidate division KSB1 bacterium]|nr:ATP-binding cassette domain-containing protein [candidate division KSB1 bacterium]
MQAFISVDRLTFTYQQAVEPLFDSLSFQLQTGWTGVVGANGSGKTTLLKLLTGLLEPDYGAIHFDGQSCYCEQRTDFIPDLLHTFIASRTQSAFRIKHGLQIQDEWINRWQQLSHGERKRCQIAVALYLNPALLAIDEPSNHLDHSGRKVLFHALQSYQGVGLLVSHERELLDELCRHTIFLMPGRVDLRKCNYSTAAAEIAREEKAQLQEYVQVKREVKKFKRKVAAQKQQAQQSDKRRSKAALDRKNHDARAKKDLARVTGKDAVAGRSVRRLQSQLQRTADYQQSLKVKKSYTLGISFNDRKIARLFPLIINSGSLTMGEDKFLRIPELTVQEGEKIGIIGDNGSGKSMFIEHCLNILTLPRQQIIYIPQEISILEAQRMIRRIQAYDSNTKGRIMTIIRRLGSDPAPVLQTT